MCWDHNHATGEFRDYICRRCNNGLGQFKDSPLLLRKAVEYLLKHGFYGQADDESINLTVPTKETNKKLSEWLTVDEAAPFLDMSAKTIRRYIDKEQFPFEYKREDGEIKIKASEVMVITCQDG